jgi:hypothetical protein
MRVVKMGADHPCQKKKEKKWGRITPATYAAN